MLDTGKNYTRNSKFETVLMSGWNAEGTKGRCLCSQPDLHTSLYPKYSGH